MNQSLNMPTIKREKIVSYSPVQMFELVNAVEDYPSFVPYCKSAAVLNQQLDERQVRLDFSKGALHKSFTTHNRLQENKMIQMRLVDGPFKQLEGFWQFEAAAEGCRVQLDIEFEFSNKVVAMLFGPVFNTVTNTLVDVFCQRAKQVFDAA
jgi:ribosome-associated toxin RatA of RatAB toxin-antitoxin module